MEQNVNEGISWVKVFCTVLDPNSHAEQSVSTDIDSISGTVSIAFDISHGCLRFSKHSLVSVVKTLKISALE